MNNRRTNEAGDGSEQYVFADSASGKHECGANGVTREQSILRAGFIDPTLPHTDLLVPVKIYSVLKIHDRNTASSVVEVLLRYFPHHMPLFTTNRETESPDFVCGYQPESEDIVALRHGIRAILLMGLLSESLREFASRFGFRILSLTGPNPMERNIGWTEMDMVQDAVRHQAVCQAGTFTIGEIPMVNRRWGDYRNVYSRLTSSFIRELEDRSAGIDVMIRERDKLCATLDAPSQ